MNPNDIINNRFRLLRSIGRGSFGEVWLAEDTILGLNVALKIYVALDSHGYEDFKNEFRNVCNIHHTNLLHADYFDKIGDNPYLVMRFCPGSSVELVNNASEQDLLRFTKDVAKGLAYLHSQDIIHRDIKPDNILRDEVGNYVISDFGLSLKMRTTLLKASKRINEMSSSGTIGYMAPELFSANPEAVKATDVWALGATIYEIATGNMPFVGQGGVMQLHGAELPALPPRFSPRLTNLMQRCLAKEPWERPTAEQIAAECEAIEQGIATPPFTPGGSPQGRKPQPTVKMQKQANGGSQYPNNQHTASTRIDSAYGGGNNGGYGNNHNGGNNGGRKSNGGVPSWGKILLGLGIFGGIVSIIIAIIVAIIVFNSTPDYGEDDYYWDTDSAVAVEEYYPLVDSVEAEPADPSYYYDYDYAEPIADSTVDYDYYY